jgi:hypothetical protein
VEEVWKINEWHAASLANGVARPYHKIVFDFQIRMRHSFRRRYILLQLAAGIQNGTVFRRQIFVNGYEMDKKILFHGGEVFTNYAKRGGRTYGFDGGELCFDKKKDGER